MCSEILVGDVVSAVEHEFVAVDNAPLAHHEHVHAGDGLLPEEPDDIGIKVTRAYRMLLIAQSVDGVDARLDAAGPLEIELGRGFLHFPGKLFDEFPMVA